MKAPRSGAVCIYCIQDRAGHPMSTYPDVASQPFGSCVLKMDLVFVCQKPKTRDVEEPRFRHALNFDSCVTAHLATPLVKALRQSTARRVLEVLALALALALVVGSAASARGAWQTRASRDLWANSGRRHGVFRGDDPRAGAFVHERLADARHCDGHGTVTHMAGCAAAMHDTQLVGNISTALIVVIFYFNFLLFENYLRLIPSAAPGEEQRRGRAAVPERRPGRRKIRAYCGVGRVRLHGTHSSVCRSHAECLMRCALRTGLPHVRVLQVERDLLPPSARRLAAHGEGALSQLRHLPLRAHRRRVYLAAHVLARLVRPHGGRVLDRGAEPDQAPRPPHLLLPLLHLGRGARVHPAHSRLLRHGTYDSVSS
ncbi:hypothetical protein PybrP1_009328 [[Pythium] brassicae (nom. inval.)]|nr:hypothetical protein PybrP1_009328 [[Pythium] brassicae (nom. inval.)]